MDRNIEIRLTQQREVSIDGKGKKTERLGPEPERIGAAICPVVEQAVRERFGNEVSVSFSAARTPEVRLNGNFPGFKPAEVKSTVQAIVSEALEHLDADALS